MVESLKDAEEKPDKKKPGLLRYIRNRFITGVIIALPLAATFWLISWFVGFVDESVYSILPESWTESIDNKNTQQEGSCSSSCAPEQNDDPKFIVPGTGLVVAFIALLILGIIGSNFIGNRLLLLGERVLYRVPFVSNVYNGLKQIVNTVAKSDERNFKEVCLVEYPRPGLWAIGFVTSDLKGAPKEFLKENYVSIFVPTTPNPTSGFLLFSKREDLKILNMTPEEGAKMIISGGIVSNDDAETLAKQFE